VLRRFTGLAVIVLARALLLAWASPASPLLESVSSPAGSSGAVALDLAGKTVKPFEVSAGRPLILIFVRTDCPVSNRYAPTIQALGQRYAGTAVMMLVYPDRSETPRNIEKHLREYGYKMAALRDTQHELVKVSKVEITPEAAVFDRRGELIYHGRIDNWYVDFGHARSAPSTHELDEAIQAAVNGGHPVPTSVSGIGCYISDLQ
jgi:thiol-disulfide isomerase/thioredoxin